MRFHGEPGRIELVAQQLGDAETDWFVLEYGGGVMVLERVSGRTFIPADQLPGVRRFGVRLAARNG